MRKHAPILSVVICLFFFMSAKGQQKPDFTEIRRLQEEGRQFVQAGKFEEALEVTLKLEKLDPLRPEIQLNLGNILGELKRFDESVRAFRRALELRPEHPLAYLGLCRTLDVSGKREDAIAACKEAVRLDPTNAKASEYLISLESDWAVGGNIGVKVPASLAAELNSLAAQGQQYLADAEYAKAAEVFERLAAASPSNGWIFDTLSQIYQKLDRGTDAVKAARRFVELEPANYLSHLSLGQTLLASGFYFESADPLLRAVELKRDCGEGYLYLSRAYETIGDKKNTLETLRHAYKYLPPTFEVTSRFGEALNQYSLYTEAIEPLQKAAAMQPKDPVVRAGLGLALMMQNRFDEAIVQMDEADRLRPDDPYITQFVKIARARQLRRGYLQQIIAFVEKNPDNVKARLDLGSAYRYNGRNKEAEQEYLAAVKLDPKNKEESLTMLGIFYSETGRTSDALEYARKVNALAPNHVQWMSIGGMLERLGRLDEAIEAYRKSIQIKSTFPESHLALGEALARQGKHSEALQSFQNAFSVDPAHRRTNFDLAWQYIRLGNKEGAIRHYQIVKGLVPNEVEALARCIRAHFGPIL